MEIRIFLRYIYISCCVNLVTYLEAKPVSLNDIIEAEQNYAEYTSTSKYTSPGTAVTQGKKTSPLKYRQAFEIKSPSKPKKLILSQRQRLKRKNISKKREINQNDKVIQKYIPLLKNLRLFFDNILGSESSEIYESKGQKFKRNPFNTDPGEVFCACERQSNSDPASHSQEASTPATTIATEVEVDNVAFTITSTTPTYIIVNDNIRRLGRHKNVPLLLTRNSSSLWRNDSGLGQGGGSSSNGSIERYIANDDGNNERNAGKGEIISYTENYEEYTDSYSRNDASRNRSRSQQHRTNTENSEDIRRNVEIHESTVPRNEAFQTTGRNFLEHEREIDFKIRGYETESPLLVPEFVSRLRGFDSEETGTPVRRAKTNQKSATQIGTSNNRLINRNGSFTSKNQEISTTDTAIEPQHVLPNSSFPVGKVVMIFDGYSVAKDVNGDNKLTEKAVHIHT